MMSVAESPLLSTQSTAVPQSTLLPTLFGEGYGIYRTRPTAFVLSYAVNFLVTALMIWSGHWFVEHRHEIKRQVDSIVTDVSPYILPSSATRSGGGGGGGAADKLSASKGSPPKFANEQITPPAVVVRNDNPNYRSIQPWSDLRNFSYPKWLRWVIRFQSSSGHLPVAPALVRELEAAAAAVLVPDAVPA